MKSQSNLPARYRPWLAFMRRYRRQAITGCLAAAASGWVAFWLATSGLWYWCFQLVAPCMVIGITVRLIWSAIEDDAPHPEPGWQGAEMEVWQEDSTAPILDGGKGPEKYSARGVPASPATPEVLVDEYSPEYISALVAKMEKENRERQRRGPEFEVEG